MNKNIIPHRLKTARKIQGLSMEGLSKKMEGLISKQAISKYELYIRLKVDIVKDGGFTDNGMDTFYGVQ